MISSKIFNDFQLKTIEKEAKIEIRKYEEEIGKSYEPARIKIRFKYKMIYLNINELLYIPRKDNVKEIAEAIKEEIKGKEDIIRYLEGSKDGRH